MTFFSAILVFIEKRNVCSLILYNYIYNIFSAYSVLLNVRHILQKLFM